MSEKNSENQASISTYAPFDRRALSLVIFQKLHRELMETDIEMEEKEAARLIREAIDLLPDFKAEPGEKINQLLLTRVSDRNPPVVFDIQDAIDSLMIVWKDFQNLIHKL